jgi:hypothetical protein
VIVLLLTCTNMVPERRLSPYVHALQGELLLS